MFFSLNHYIQSLNRSCIFFYIISQVNLIFFTSLLPVPTLVQAAINILSHVNYPSSLLPGSYIQPGTH